MNLIVGHVDPTKYVMWVWWMEAMQLAHNTMSQLLVGLNNIVLSNFPTVNTQYYYINKGSCTVVNHDSVRTNDSLKTGKTLTMLIENQ